jgi:hypothetical protein
MNRVAAYRAKALGAREMAAQAADAERRESPYSMSGWRNSVLPTADCSTTRTGCRHGLMSRRAVIQTDPLPPGIYGADTHVLPRAGQTQHRRQGGWLWPTATAINGMRCARSSNGPQRERGEAFANVIPRLAQVAQGGRDNPTFPALERSDAAERARADVLQRMRDLSRKHA